MGVGTGSKWENGAEIRKSLLGAVETVLLADDKMLVLWLGGSRVLDQRKQVRRWQELRGQRSKEPAINLVSQL